MDRHRRRNDMLCEICQQREATVHETQIAGDVLKSRNLCEPCYQATEPAQATNLGEALKSGCRYCGGEPYSGGGSSLPGRAGEISFMCKPCTEEYCRFLDSKIPGFNECAGPAPHLDGAVATKKILRAGEIVENHRLERVAERMRDLLIMHIRQGNARR